jgi:hypothetical protein
MDVSRRSPSVRVSASLLLLYVQDRRVPTDSYPALGILSAQHPAPRVGGPFVAEVHAIEPRISTVGQRTGLHSDDVLLKLEASRSEADRIRRPVLFP